MVFELAHFLDNRTVDAFDCLVTQRTGIQSAKPRDNGRLTLRHMDRKIVCTLVLGHLRDNLGSLRQQRYHLCIDRIQTFTQFV